MRVRQLPVSFLPFVRRWLPMPSLEISQGVLPTLFCRSILGRLNVSYQAESPLE
jgi:hypothetical protein